MSLMFLIKIQASHCLQTWDTFQLRLCYTNRHHAEKTAKCLYYRWRELNLQLKIFEVSLDWYKARFKALCENRTTEKTLGKTLGTSVDNSCSLVIKSIKTTRPPI